MANRNFKRGAIGCLDREMVKLFGKVLLGNNVITSQSCLGFTVTRTGAGLYTITFDDRYPNTDADASGNVVSPFFGLDVQLMTAAAQTGTARPIADSVSAAAKTLTWSWDVGGASTDPATGGTFLIEVTLRNTSAPRKGV